MANPIDIVLWPDGYWCFRAELHEELMRDDNYRVISQIDAEWFVHTKQARAYVQAF